jgi:hypothetical protein
VVVGDDDVEAERAGVGDLVDRGDPAVDRDDGPYPSPASRVSVSAAIP